MFCLNEYDSCAELAYCIGRNYWGRGIASEALKAVLKFGLTEVNLNRIEAYHAVENLSSGKVMQNSIKSSRKNTKSIFIFCDNDRERSTNIRIYNVYLFK